MAVWWDMYLSTRSGKFSVDIKAARKGLQPPCRGWEGLPRTIYVLGQYSDAADRVTLLGWEWWPLSPEGSHKGFWNGGGEPLHRALPTSPPVGPSRPDDQLMVVLKHSQEDRGLDFYQTPPEATLALIRAELLPHAIWEPSCGLGAIAEILLDAGHAVVATDIEDRGYGFQSGTGDFSADR